MACPHCSSNNVANRSRLTRHGYKTFFCKNCRRTFNERTNTPFNRCQTQTVVVFKAILWRLRYKLSFGDLAEMFAVEVKQFYFTREAIRQWEARFAPLITDETKLSEIRTLESTTAFLEQAARTTGQKPTQLTTDKDATYPGAIEKVVGKKVEHRTSHYLNNRMEQDHRGIKARYKVMKSFKNPTSAERFCQAFDEQRNFFKFQRWHKDRRSQKWQRGNFKSKFFQLKKKFCQRKQFWQQSALPLQV